MIFSFFCLSFIKRPYSIYCFRLKRKWNIWFGGGRVAGPSLLFRINAAMLSLTFNVDLSIPAKAKQTGHAMRPFPPWPHLRLGVFKPLDLMTWLDDLTWWLDLMTWLDDLTKFWPDLTWLWLDLTKFLSPWLDLKNPTWTALPRPHLPPTPHLPTHRAPAHLHSA